MLLKITTKCDMGCSHCLDNATKNGVDMSIDTLKDVLKFLRRTDLGRLLVISGGEPMNHPDFYSIMKYILEDYEKRFGKFFKIIITTNGEMMNSKENIDIIQDLLTIYSLQLNIQMTNDPKYYPRKVELDSTYRFFNKQISLTTKMPYKINPIGRGKNVDYNKNYRPLCSNMILATKQLIDKHSPKKLAVIEAYLQLNKHNCCPAILPNGDIILGESATCKVCSNIYKSEEQIIDDIYNFRCDQCSFDNVPPEALEIIRR